MSSKVPSVQRLFARLCSGPDHRDIAGLTSLRIGDRARQLHLLYGWILANIFGYQELPLDFAEAVVQRCVGEWRPVSVTTPRERQRLCTGPLKC